MPSHSWRDLTPPLESAVKYLMDDIKPLDISGFTKRPSRPGSQPPIHYPYHLGLFIPNFPHSLSQTT